MSQTNPLATTFNDICTAALKEAKAFGIGQTPLAENITDAFTRLLWMLQQWNRKRWMIYHLVTYVQVSTGALSYSMGPGGVINTGVGTVRPARIESAFLRQPAQGSSGALPIDYPLEILKSMEDYNRIRLKTMQSFPQFVFMDTAVPLALVYVWPVPQPGIYSIGISVLDQLPVSATTLGVEFEIPFEYYYAMVTNLAIRLKPLYGMSLSPGDPLPALAKDALNVIKTTNFQIGRLQMPKEYIRSGLYNIFSDSQY